ncbi:MAG: peptidoglycan DD-metalloendopeptidase family protein [Candidatus Firestonebacteria bacterium]
MHKNILEKIFGKKITIMIVPHHNVKIFQFKTPLVIAIFSFLLVLSVVSYSVYIIKCNIDYNVSQESVKILKDKAFVLNEQFEKLQDRVQKFAEQEKKLKEMVGYENKKALVEGKGMGGPTKTDQKSLENLLNSEIKKDDIKETLNKMVAEIELREQSFKEVEKYILKQRSIWSATPKGLPIKGYITSTFGYGKMVLDYMGDSDSKDKKDWHMGIDIANRIGSKIKATGDGKVIFAGKLGGYGLLVIVDHGYGFTTRYAHCSKILIKKGDEVKREDAIALVGITGHTTGPHVHYEVRRYGRAVDPATIDPRIYAKK